MMGLICKTQSNNSKREILSLKTKEMVPTGIAENFNSTLQALSSHLRIKDVKGKYLSNTENFGHLTFDDMYDCNLASLKEHLENKERVTKS
jgi:hypothetical protein